MRNLKPSLYLEGMKGAGKGYPPQRSVKECTHRGQARSVLHRVLTRDALHPRQRPDNSVPKEARCQLQVQGQMPFLAAEELRA